MASNDDGKFDEKKKETQMLHSKKVKSQLQEVFREMTDKISHANFNEIFKQIRNTDVVITNEEQIVQTFKDELLRKIKDNLNDMWHHQDIDVGLTMLNFCKEKCKGNTTSWRPSDKTLEEQTRYLRIHYLKKKIEYLEHVLQYQQQSLGVILQDVEHKRKLIEELSTRRDHISNQMDIRMMQMSAKDNIYEELQRNFCE